MEIKCERLTLKPLSLKELETYMASREKFEESSNLNVSGVKLEGECCEELLEIIESNPGVWSSNDYLSYTLWLLIDTKLKSIVGQFWFNGKPTENGELEMFFSIEKPFRKKGYATEAVKALLEWVKGSQMFRVLLVEAFDHNLAAINSLKKLGFRKIEPDTDSFLSFSDEDEELPISTNYFLVAYAKDLKSEELDFEV